MDILAKRRGTAPAKNAVADSNGRGSKSNTPPCTKPPKRTGSGDIDTRQRRRQAERKHAKQSAKPETPTKFFDHYLRERGSSLGAAEREGSELRGITAMQRAGYQKQFAAVALSFPCVDPTDGTPTGPGRVRYMDPPPIDNEGKSRKFNQPYGDGMQPPYIAYNTLGDWTQATKNRKVDIYIGEGETRALAFALHERYFIGLGGKDGAFVAGSKRGKLIPWFDKIKWKGRRVFIISDSDWFTNPDVRASYKALAALLAERGAVVRIIKWRALFKEKEGADDLIGMGLFNFIERLCENTPEWNDDSDAEWPEPQPFYNTLPPVPRMTEDMIPEALRAWIVDETHRLNVPLEYVAVPAMYTLGLTIMTRAVMRPKNQGDQWAAPGFLWCAIIAPSSGKKTPAFTIAMKPISVIEKRLAEEMARKNKFHELNLMTYKKATTEWMRKAEQAIVDQKPLPEPLNIPEVPKVPPKPRVLVWNSATVEALQEHLKKSSIAGVGYYRDELAGLLEELNKPGREGDRSFLIEGMEANMFKSARIGRGETVVPKNAVAVGGGIQPVRLNGMILDGLKNGPTNDGLLPRLALTVYPDVLPDEEVAFVNETPDAEAYQRALKLYEKLDALDHEKPTTYTFDKQAQKLFGEWYVHAEHYRRSADLPEIVKSHFGKYDRLIAVLAMQFKLCEEYGEECGGTKNVVELRHLRLAFRWASLLERHALRMYHSGVTPARAAAQSLAEKIQRSRLKTTDGVFRLKDVYENDWAGMNTPDEARAAVNILASYDWVREVAPEDRRGKPSEKYKLNPHVTSAYPEVNTKKVQNEPSKPDGISRGKKGGGLVPAHFWEEEVEKCRLRPSTPLSPPNFKNKTKSRATVSPRKFTKEYRAAQCAVQSQTTFNKSAKGGR